MLTRNPKHLFIAGFILLLIGVAIPFLIVTKVIPSTFFLNFFAYGAQVVGVLLGVFGAVFYTQFERESEDKDDDYERYR